MAQQVAGVLHREQVLPGRERALVGLRELGVQRVVERLDRLLVPEQVVRRQRLGVGQRGVAVEAPVGVDGQPLPGLEHLQHGVDPAQVVVERRTADLHLDDGVAAVGVAAHLVLQGGQPLLRVVVAPGGVDEDPALRAAVAVPVREQDVQRLLLELRDGVPHRHVERPDGDRPLAVATGLLVGHDGGPHAVGVEHAPLVEQRLGRGTEQPGDEALAQQRALAVPPVGVEAVADHGAPVALLVGDDRDEAERHPAEVDVGVADRRADREGLLADVDDPHCGLLGSGPRP